jgi:hypothetical protein
MNGATLFFVKNGRFVCFNSKSYLHMQCKCIIYHLVLSFASELQNMPVDSVQSWIESQMMYV